MSTTDPAEKQTKDALFASVGLAALVADRIYPDEIPEKAADGRDVELPAVEFSRSNSDPTYTLDSTLAATNVTVDVTVWAKTRSDANAVARAVLAAMGAAGIEQSAQASAFEPESRQYAAVLSFDVWETS